MKKFIFWILTSCTLGAGRTDKKKVTERLYPTEETYDGLNKCLHLVLFPHFNLMFNL